MAYVAIPTRVANSDINAAADINQLMENIVARVKESFTTNDYEFRITHTGYKTINFINNMNLYARYDNKINEWSTSGNLNTARHSLAGSGTQNSALSFGGFVAAVSAVTEKYHEPYHIKMFITAIEDKTDDTSSERIDLECIENNATLTINCPAVIQYSLVCEVPLMDSHNTSPVIVNYGQWAASGNLNTARRSLAGSGTQNSALSFGGFGAAISAVTEKFSGSTWAASGNLNTERYSLAGSGTQNAALSFGGDIGAVSAVTEKFSGSTWAASGNLNTARYGPAGSGTQNSALSFGGDTPAISAVTEKFSGSTWTASGNLNTAREGLGGSGTQNAALSFGGNTPAVSAVTEKFSKLYDINEKFSGEEYFTGNIESKIIY
jgi:hypothetical protein